MPTDSTATKTRILDAAFREFAAHGLAGARVDRIAATAKANKRAIYEYFGNKEALFDLVLVDVVARGAEEVPQRWDDLPAYAGLIYDYFTADPDRMRIHLWRQLERPQALDGEQDAYAQMIEQMSAARPADSRFDPAELFALVWALHFTWFLASPTLIGGSLAGRHPTEQVTASSAGAEDAAGSSLRSPRSVVVEAVRQLAQDASS